MDAITGYIAVHPTVFVICIILIVLLILNIIFKSMVKFIIAMLIIALVAFGYFYFKAPGDISQQDTESGGFIKSSINQIKDTGKNFIKDGKDLYNKGKAAPKEVDKLLDSSGKELDKELKK